MGLFIIHLYSHFIHTLFIFISLTVHFITIIMFYLYRENKYKKGN